MLPSHATSTRRVCQGWLTEVRDVCHAMVAWLGMGCPDRAEYRCDSMRLMAHVSCAAAIGRGTESGCSYPSVDRGHSRGRLQSGWFRVVSDPREGARGDALFR